MRPIPEDYPLVDYRSLGKPIKIGIVQNISNKGQKTGTPIKKMTIGIYDGENQLYNFDTIILKGKTI